MMLGSQTHVLRLECSDEEPPASNHNNPPVTSSQEVYFLMKALCAEVVVQAVEDYKYLLRNGYVASGTLAKATGNDQLLNFYSDKEIRELLYFLNSEAFTNSLFIAHPEIDTHLVRQVIFGWTAETAPTLQAESGPIKC